MREIAPDLAKSHILEKTFLKKKIQELTSHILTETSLVDSY